MSETGLWSVEMRGGVSAASAGSSASNPCRPRGPSSTTGPATPSSVAASSSPCRSSRPRISSTDKLKRIVAPAVHDWQADGAALAHVYCAKTAGRHVWVRNVTYAEARDLGVTA